jgi:hypothetical protein
VRSSFIMVQGSLSRRASLQEQRGRLIAARPQHARCHAQCVESLYTGAGKCNRDHRARRRTRRVVGCAPENDRPPIQQARSERDVLFDSARALSFLATR